MSIPLTLLTGFLGSGKTTLLNRILHGDHGLRVAVLVNDFGAINIDTQLVVGVEGETISLANGCICCTIRDDLLQAALQLVERAEPPEYILVETSGVSDPEAVAVTFLLPELRSRIYLDSILTVVDAEHVLGLQGADILLAEDQVALADIVILNKVDLVTTETLEQVRAWLQEIAPRARVLETMRGNAPLALLLGVGAFSPERLHQRARRDVHVHEEQAASGSVSDPHHHHDHDHMCGDDHADHVHTDHSLVYSTWSFVSNEPFSYRAVREAVKTLPANIFRAKGVLYLADVPDRRGILHVVGRRVRLTLGEPWAEQTPRSQFVMIGSAGSIDAVELNRRFEACLAKNIPAPAPVSLEAALEWVRTTFGLPAASA